MISTTAIAIFSLFMFGTWPFSEPGIGAPEPAGNFYHYSILLKQKEFGSTDTSEVLITMLYGEIPSGDSLVETFRITRDSVVYCYDGNEFTVANQRRKRAITYRVDPRYYINFYNLEKFLVPLRVRSELVTGNSSRKYTEYKRSEAIVKKDTSAIITAIKIDSAVTGAGFNTDYRLVFHKADPERFKLEEWISRPGAGGLNAYHAWVFFEADKAPGDSLCYVPEDFKKNISYATSDRFNAPVDSGTVMEDFSFALPSGDSTRFSAQAGEITLLTFWFIDSPPCVESNLFLNRYAGEMKNTPLKIIALNPLNKAADIALHDERNGILFRTGLINRKLVRTVFNVKTFPTFFILDKDRRVLWSSEGFNETKEARIRQVIGNLLGKH